MEHDHGPLPDDLATAHQLIRELLETLAQQIHLNAQLQHQLEQLLRHRYGRKGERVDPAQLLLFAQEVLAQARPTPDPAPNAAPEPPPAPTPPTPPKKGHGRKPLPPSLPRRRVLHDLPPERRACPDCGGPRDCIGEEIREQLEYVPASLIVIQHVRPKYACAGCAAHVAIAERLPEPIEKGLPGPGLLAHVITNKYADHLPLYRQEGILLRHGIELSRSTLCDWMATAAELLQPIVKRMLAEVLRSKVVQNDDTPVKVQGQDGQGMKTGRLWASIGDHDHRYVVYQYTPDRSGAGPGAIFQGFRGYLQADAYSAYDALYASGAIVEVGCLMHARRKFYEARTTDPKRSHEALAWIGLLYEVERQAKQWPGAEDYEVFVAARHALRQERSRPIFVKFRAWLEAESAQVLPKSPIGEAIQYALNHWAALERPLEAGFLELDNGACERALRPIALGRKNWLFAGSDRGGQTAAVLMSLCTTCKDLGIDPQAYLRDVLDRISTHPAKRIDELLPDRWQALRQAEPAAPD
ncbi:MAG: IS66 family transposase [Solirubrobacterales bacterium]|nr:IS66 family transposase [Solirubrobacterales bacterium]